MKLQVYLLGTKTRTRADPKICENASSNNGKINLVSYIKQNQPIQPQTFVMRSWAVLVSLKGIQLFYIRHFSKKRLVIRSCCAVIILH